MAGKKGTYRSNIFLKNANQPFEWTPALIKEYLKCSKDSVYFAEKYIKAVNVDEGRIDIKLYPYQKEIIKSMEENRHTIVATARQAGKCFFYNSKIILKNKNTGEIQSLTIGEFYDRIKKL